MVHLSLNKGLQNNMLKLVKITSFDLVTQVLKRIFTLNTETWCLLSSKCLCKLPLPPAYQAYGLIPPAKGGRVVNQQQDCNNASIIADIKNFPPNFFFNSQKIGGILDDNNYRHTIMKPYMTHKKRIKRVFLRSGVIDAILPLTPASI